MNSLEAIIELENKLDIMGYAFEETEIIKQDLERLEKLEKENEKLKRKLEEIKELSYSMPSHYRDIIKEVEDSAM